MERERFWKGENEHERRVLFLEVWDKDEGNGWVMGGMVGLALKKCV